MSEANTSDPTLPLSGVRVLDMGWSWAGPYAGMVLADLGAEVIKLESNARIDVLRWSGAFANNVMDFEYGGFYAACNRGKKSATLNLKEERSRQLVLDLVSKCDAVIENFAPRVLPNLGLSGAAMLAANPQVVMLSMSGYGATGPESDFVAYGDHMNHSSGFAAITGDPRDRDTKIGTFYGDPVAGMYGALAIIAALEDRERTGEGRHMDYSQQEGLLSLFPTKVMAASRGEDIVRYGDKSPNACPHGFYRCKGEDAWVSISVSTEDQYQALSMLMLEAGLPLPEAGSLDARLAEQETIDAFLFAWTSDRSVWQVTHELQAVGVAAYPLASAQSLLLDDQLAEREFFQWLHHDVTGPAPTPGMTFKIAGANKITKAAPTVGQDNDYVFLEILGMDPAEYAELQAAQVIF